MIEIIGPKGTKIEKYDFLVNLIGKKVIAKNGEVIGRVGDVAIKDYDIKGVFCKSAAFGRVYIDKSHFEALPFFPSMQSSNSNAILAGALREGSIQAFP